MGVPRRAVPNMRARWRSSETVSSTKGRCTLTATSSPLERNVALYTCPSDAAATGSGVILEKISEISICRSSRIVCMARAESNGGTLSHSCWSWTIACGERISGRIESAWPSFMKNGPRETRTPRSRATAATSASEPEVILPRRVSKMTDASQPDVVVPTWSTRVSTAPGRLLKYAARASGSYTSGSWSAPSPRRISTTCIVVPLAAASSSLILLPRSACISAAVDSSASMAERTSRSWFERSEPDVVMMGRSDVCC
mmetsp:Transcript_38388/g.76924  ORF Transcript_38388/g.76924 Transcript_38388/m.76924 type:complete len:257 (+) Transcript_38388:1860-2630(+)